MKFSLRSSRPLLGLALVALGSLSSCQRGMGCPTNFSLNDFLVDGVATLAGLLF